MNIVRRWDISGHLHARVLRYPNSGQCYRVTALISVNIVPNWDIEGRELASVRRYPNEEHISVITLLLYSYKYFSSVLSYMFSFSLV